MRRRPTDPRRALAVLLLALAAGASLSARPLRADEDAASARLPLDAFRAARAVAGPRALWVPTDAAFADDWTDPDGSADRRLLDFEAPPFDETALHHEALASLVRRLVPGSATWDDRATEASLDLWGPPAAIARARTALAHVQAALAPRLDVRLVATDGSGLVGVGAVRLLPRRWTTALLRVAHVRHVVDYNVEIAQDTVANQPMVVALPEGEEVHLRWTPGERVSLVEVFVGVLRHQPPHEVDLSPLRNTPEANTMGVVTLPKTSVRRVLVAAAVDAGKGGTLEWSLADPTAPALALRLDVGPAPAAPADLEVEKGVVGFVRAGAAYAGLDAGPRDATTDDAIRRFQSASSLRGASPETTAQAFFVCEGSRAELARLRASTLADEAALAPVTVEVRVVAPPAKQVAADLAAGRLALGAALDAALEEAYANAPVVAAVRTPACVGLPVAARCGASVAGFVGAEVEVAQQAGAVDLRVEPFFDGFVGRLVVRPRAGGFTLECSGALSWADPAARSLSLAYRRPLSMSPYTGEHATNERIDNPAVRRATVPLVGAGQTALDASVALSEDDAARGRLAVLAVVLRPRAGGGLEPLVVLGAVRR